MKKSFILSLAFFCNLFIAIPASAQINEKTVEKVSDAGMVMGIVGIVLAVVGIGLAVAVFIITSLRLKNYASIERMYKKLSSSRNISQSDNDINNDLSDRIERMALEIKTLRKRVDKLNAGFETPQPEVISSAVFAQNEALQKPVEHHATTERKSYETPLPKPKSIQEKPESDQPAPNQEITKGEPSENTGSLKDNSESDKEKGKENVTRTFFVGLPQGDTFVTVRDSFKPNETLYMITTNDGVSGKIEFIDRKETIGIARRSVTSWLEPVCDIVGNQPDGLNRVNTRQPGEVIKTSNGWQLKSKSVVELS